MPFVELESDCLVFFSVGVLFWQVSSGLLGLLWSSLPCACLLMLDVVLVELARGQIFWRDLLLICRLVSSYLAIGATLILDASHRLKKEWTAQWHASHRFC